MKLFRTKYLLIFTSIMLTTSMSSCMNQQPKELKLEDFKEVDPVACGICYVEFEEADLITRCPFNCKTVGYHPACFEKNKAAQQSINYKYSMDNSFPCPSCSGKMFQMPKAFMRKAITELQKAAAPAQAPQAPAPKAPTPKTPAPTATKIPVASQAKPAAQASNNPAVDQTQCNFCQGRFQAEDLVTQCSAHCAALYHTVCFTELVESSTDRACPHCKRHIEDMPNVRRYKHTADEKPEAVPVGNPHTVHATRPAPQAPFITPELISEGLAAFVYGMVAQHLWTSPQLTKSQRWGSLGGLGASLIVLQRSLNHSNPARSADIKKRSGAWLSGLVLGFTVPWLAKKLDQKYAFFRARAS